MWKSVYSKIFSQKLRGFQPIRQNDIQKAVDRVTANPDIDGYKRLYLSPYRQEHPTDKTLTIFFVVPQKPTGRVFFVWVNDDNYLHDTHKNHGEDPCVKEFKRLRDSKRLEEYSEDFHEGKLTPIPRLNAPKFLKFEKYGTSVHANVLHDGTTHYAMSIVTPDNPQALFDHYAQFIEKTREHFIGLNEPFEFRVFDGDLQFEELLQKNLDHTKWKKTVKQGETIFAV